MKPTTRIHIAREAIGGITTFFTMAYIVLVNPEILATQGTGMSFNGVMTATVLLCFSMTLLMGLYAKLPFAVAPGMGINAFFAFTLILGRHVPWTTALGMIFWSGVLFVLISVTPLRAAVARAIPKDLRIASAAGIGFFLTFIGLKNAGFLVADPATFVKIGKLGPTTVMSILGFALMILLLKKKNPFAFLAGIFAVTVMAGASGWVHLPVRLWSMPDFGSVFLKLDPWGALKLALLPSIISVMFTDLFDSISTFVGVSQATGLLDKDGQPKNLKQGLIVDAFATLGASLVGTSSGTAYIESAAGIEAGARTGLASVFTALCFLPCFFLAPLAAIVPDYATAPVLVLVGGLMFKSITELSTDKLEDLIPSYLTIILIPLTFSITQGMLWGFIAHVALYVVAGRRKEVRPAMFGIALISVFLVVLDSLQR